MKATRVGVFKVLPGDYDTSVTAFAVAVRFILQPFF